MTRLLIANALCPLNATKSTSERQGISPLHQAAYNGHIECVQELVEAGAKVDLKTNNDFTALHYATQVNERLESSDVFRLN